MSYRRASLAAVSLTVAAAALGGACGPSRPPAEREPPGDDGGTGDALPPPRLGGGDDGDCVGAPAAPLADGFCRPSPGDADGDGFTVADGDCDDNDCAVNPGAFDVAGNGVDDDCNGTIDDEPARCDDGLAQGGASAFDGARALGLCRTATATTRTWGVVSAAWVKPDRTPETEPLSHGLLAAFGANAPREGARMVAISSGTARAPGEPGWSSPAGWDKGYACGTPQGYPKESPACPGVKSGAPHDGAGLLLEIRVPTNARSIHVQESFFTFEYPDYICSRFNDFYVAIMTPPVGTSDGNIAFDRRGNVISVNNSLLQACRPQSAGGKTFTCPLGVEALRGTGFDEHASTGWITTRTPVARGSTITLLFTVWDSGDGILDSTVLLDDFAWSTEPQGCAVTTPSLR